MRRKRHPGRGLARPSLVVNPVIRAKVLTPGEAAAPVLVLDEPCTGLDIPTRERFLASLQKLTATRTRMIYVTHHVEEILPAISHVLYLKKGRALDQGPKREMLTGPVISKALGCLIDLTEQDGRYWISGCR